jgi:hypothetical protein
MIIMFFFEAYRNMILKADLDTHHLTKRVVQNEVSIRSEAELRLKYPFLKWFCDYVILRVAHSNILVVWIRFISILVTNVNLH